METQGLFKKAALAIRELYNEKTSLENEVNQLKAELEKLAYTRELTLKLMKLGVFPVEDFEDRFNEFSQKTAQELETFEKAAELVKMGSFNFGTLTEQPQYGGTPAERFLYSLLED